MYSFSQYINRGISLFRNHVLSSDIRLSTLMLYTTDICNSKCTHCNIWKKQPKQNLSLKRIKQIIDSSSVTSSTCIGLEGGEFLLHPQAFKILEFLQENHSNYDLLSNCLAPDKLDKALTSFTPRHLYVSLDGGRDTYSRMRGVDGYEKVIKVLEKYRHRVPVSAMFTLTPFNTFNDLKHVASVCKMLKIDLRIGIYSNMDYFDIFHLLPEFDQFEYEPDQIPSIAYDFAENFDFLALYPGFKNNLVRLPCYSIYDSLVIHPDGGVPICQFKNIVLGNINNQPLDEILNQSKTKDLRNYHCKNCNQCWINFHRKYDIILIRNLEKILPKKVIEMLLGKYQWSVDKNETYKSFVKRHIT